MILSVIVLPCTPYEVFESYWDDSYHTVYECDYVSDATCFIFNVTDLSNDFRLYPTDDINELKFVSCEFFDLSTTISIRESENHDYLNIVNLSGNHIKKLQKFHFTVNNVQRAYLSRNEIVSLENASIFDAHPTLMEIDLSFNQITFIHSEAFKGLMNLEELHLNDNKIKEVNGLMFSPLYRLHILNISVNHIETFDNDTFSALVNLISINFEKNDFFQFDFNILENNYKLIDVSIGDANSLESVEFISLIGNSGTNANYKLTKVTQSDFIANGTVVSIKNSKISTLTIGSQSTIISAKNCSLTKLIFDSENVMLSIANFSNNLLTGDVKFENLEELKILDLSFNRINRISFVNCSLLKDLNLSNNNLTFIHNMATLSNVKILDLSFNCFETLQLDTFASMHILEVLNLRQTCFQSLDYGMFSVQTNLRVLDISFNDLNTIDLNVLSSLTNLQTLFIYGNNLTDVESIELIPINHPKLRSIGLTNNRWNCKHLSSLIKKLDQLSIKIFVERAILNITNVNGIGCSTINSSHDSFIVPKNTMPIDHSVYMNRIEKINEIVKTVNDMNDKKNDREFLDNSFKSDILTLKHNKSLMESKLNDQVNQLKVFGKDIVNKLKLLNEMNFGKLMNMKEKVQILNETNNEKYNIASESIKSLEEKLQKIKLSDEKFIENVNKVGRSEIKINSKYYDDIGTIKTLEICLIILLLVLAIVALYYAVVYC